MEALGEKLPGREPVQPTRRLPDMYARLLQELPKHKYRITHAAIAAGFAPGYARCNPTTIRQRLERYLAKLTPSEIAGVVPYDQFYDMEDVLFQYKKVIHQDRDMASKLRAATPLLVKHGIIPHEQGVTVAVPTLTIVVEKGDVPPAEGTETPLL